MQISDIPHQLPEPTEKMSVPGLYHQRARVFPGTAVVERRSSLGVWQPVTIEELLADVEILGRGLIAQGVDVGDKVAILAATSFEWLLVDLAILSVGAITVPIYESNSAPQIEHILEDSDAHLVFTSTSQQAELVRSVSNENSVHVDSWDSGALTALRKAASAVSVEQFTERLDALRIDSLATITYTSGTTGSPKGVELTHRNFVATANAIHRTVPMIAQNPKTRGLLFLPLAHVLASFVMHTIACGPGVLALSPDTSTLLSDLATFQPTSILAVPRVLEKVYGAARAKAGGGIKGKLFSWSVRQAEDASRAQGQMGLGGRGKLALANALVLRKIRAVLGPNLEYIVCGGAPLPADLAHFFRGASVDILQGYGLSETTGPITLQTPGNNTPGSVGPVLMGNEIMINGADGEIRVRGSAVFRGYHNLPEITAASFENGWFCTGDLGRIDKTGQLHITGRKKELLVTAGGKNVSPEPLEESLSTHPLVGHVVAVGDGRELVGALFTLDQEMLPVWLRKKGLPVVDPASAARLPEVRDSLERAVARANSQVSRAESIRDFRIIDAEFTVENGYLTPSLKLRRNKVVADHAAEIDKLYAEAKKELR